MSTSKEDNFSEQWREALDDAELEPSPHVWSKINHSMGRKSAFGLWYYYIPAAAFLMLMALGGWYILSYALDEFKNETNQKSNIEQSQNAQMLSSDKSPKSQDTQISSKKNIDFNTKNDVLKTPDEGSDLGLTPEKRSLQEDFSKVKSVDTSRIFTGSFPVEKERKTDHLALKSLQNQVLPNTRDVILSVDGQGFKYSPLTVVSIGDTDLQSVSVPTIETTTSESKFWLAPSFSLLNYNIGLESNLSGFLRQYTSAHQIRNLNDDEFFENLNESSKNKLSYSIGLEFGYQFTKRFQLRTGIRFLQVENAQNTNAIFTDFETGEHHAFLNEIVKNDIEAVALRDAILNHPEFDPTIPSSLNLSMLNSDQMIRLNHNYQFLSIPLEIGIVLNPQQAKNTLFQKITFTVLAGVSADFLLQSNYQNTLIANNISVENNTPSTFNKLSWRANLGLQMAYKLNPKWSGFTEFNYTRAIDNLQKSGTFLNFSPESQGLRMGVKYHF